ncbi:MAG: MarR family transcriptional regulator [Clostridia bacterium]|nr:MarR family transcriptional regulator [Clostridia bacterium]
MYESEMSREERLSMLLRICGRRLYHSSCAGRTQSRVLQLLDAGDISQKDLQDRLQIQPGSVSELITKLEFKGLLIRRRNESDRRKVLLSLTEEGRQAARAARERGDTAVRFDSLAWEEQGELIRLLEKLIEGWREEGLPESELTLPSRKTP